jgi:hypothetical protein
MNPSVSAHPVSALEVESMDVDMEDGMRSPSRKRDLDSDSEQVSMMFKTTRTPTLSQFQVEKRVRR